jgi:hypothetical protein
MEEREEWGINGKIVRERRRMEEWGIEREWV